MVEPLPHPRDELVGQLGGPHGDPDRDRVGLPDRRRHQDAVGSARGFQHGRLGHGEGGRRQQRRLEQVAVEQHLGPVAGPLTHPAAGVVVVARQGQRVLAGHGHPVGPAGDAGDDRLGGHRRPRTTETRRATWTPSSRRLDRFDPDAGPPGHAGRGQRPPAVGEQQPAHPAGPRAGPGVAPGHGREQPACDGGVEADQLVARLRRVVGPGPPHELVEELGAVGAQGLAGSEQHLEGYLDLGLRRGRCLGHGHGGDHGEPRRPLVDRPARHLRRGSRPTSRR